MPSLKDIRRRIGSVSNTKQITRAMKLVSAAKLRRAQTAATSGRGYIAELKQLFFKLQLHPKCVATESVLTSTRDISKRAIVVIAGERGLCGGFNTNVIKEVEAKEDKEDANTSVIAIGRRAVSSLRSSGWTIAKQFEDLPEDASLWPIRELASELMQQFSDGVYDQVVVYYTKFHSVMRQEVCCEQLLPLVAEADPTEAAVSEEEFKSDPSPELILESLTPLLVQSILNQAGLESKASEHASRMTAMDSATRNANDLISDLRLYYNRARQSSITTELIDIVGGAEAQSKEILCQQHKKQLVEKARSYKLLVQ